MKIEYRVRPVKRFVVTRFHESEEGDNKSHSGCECCGEFDNQDQALKVAKGLAASDSDGQATVVGIFEVDHVPALAG